LLVKINIISVIKINNRQILMKEKSTYA